MSIKKEMTAEEFGRALLTAARHLGEENGAQEVIFATKFSAIIRKALGMPEPSSTTLPANIPQTVVLPEFPQWRVKYSSDGQEIARTICYGLSEVTPLLSDGYHYAVPIDEPLPIGSVLVERTEGDN